MKLNSIKTLAVFGLFMSMAIMVNAQKIQYSRFMDKRGINTFEPSKKDDVK